MSRNRDPDSPVTLLILLIALIVFFGDPFRQTTANKCKNTKMVPMTYSHIVFRNETEMYIGNCRRMGGLYYRRCTKTRVVSKPHREEYTVMEATDVEECCNGYTLSPATDKCEPNCTPRCAETGGVCVAPGQCDCQNGFELDALNRCVLQCIAGYKWNDDHEQCEPVCDDGCTYGTCSAPNVCTCDVGYDEDHTGRCTPIACTPGCINGVCVAHDTCECQTGFGPSAEPHTCEPICQHCDNSNQICVAPEVCDCKPGFRHTLINSMLNICEPVCEPPCGEHSDCTAPDRCDCAAGYVRRDNATDAAAAVVVCVRVCTFGYERLPGEEKCRPHCAQPCRSGPDACIAPNVCADKSTIVSAMTEEEEESATDMSAATTHPNDDSVSDTSADWESTRAISEASDATKPWPCIPYCDNTMHDHHPVVCIGCNLSASGRAAAECHLELHAEPLTAYPLNAEPVPELCYYCDRTETPTTDEMSTVSEASASQLSVVASANGDEQRCDGRAVVGLRLHCSDPHIGCVDGDCDARSGACICRPGFVPDAVDHRCIRNDIQLRDGIVETSSSIPSDGATLDDRNVSTLESSEIVRTTVLMSTIAVSVVLVAAAVIAYAHFRYRRAFYPREDFIEDSSAI